MVEEQTSREARNEGGGSFYFELSSPQFQINSTEESIEEVRLDGSRRTRRITNQLELRRGWTFKASIPSTKWAMLAFLVIIAVLIGIIAVGPEEVWNWLTGLVGTIIK